MSKTVIKGKGASSLVDPHRPGTETPLVPRETLADEVRRVLLGRILDGTYPPGHRLVELKLARELGISQGPIREAMRALEVIGLIETAAYRGTYVRPLDDAEIREIFQVRASLEELAGQLAATRLEGDVAELERQLHSLRAAVRESDAEAVAREDLQFHRLIVAAAGNAVLLHTWESLGFEVRLRLLLSKGAWKGYGPELAESHQPIVDALARPDGAAAGKLLREHCVGAARFWWRRDFSAGSEPERHDSAGV